jgi:aarF domain-containing kinase
LGQWAASRTDIFPNELCITLSKLHSNVKAHRLRYTRRIIREAFGGLPLDEIFEDFQNVPIGVGSIAQVYKAKLRPNLVPSLKVSHKLETKRSAIRKTLEPLVLQKPPETPTSSVAIKVLHPGVEKIVLRDLRIMKIFAGALNAIPSVQWLSLPDEVAKFSEMMRLQLDLRIEASNLKEFRQHFENRNTVTFPLPYQDYSTRTVLIEEFADGLPLQHFLDDGGGVYNKALAYMGLDAFLV